MALYSKKIGGSVKKSFNRADRSLIFTILKDELENNPLLGDFRLNQIVGPVAQDVLREAVRTYAYFKPIDVVETKEKIAEDKDGKDVFKEKYKFKVELYIPGLNEKFTLTREFDKNKFETQFDDELGNDNNTSNP